jgi:heme/copper-type cytochrome/quinol oxidase subunit 2
LATGAGVVVATLDAVRRHRAHTTTLVQSNATEYVWVVIPWLIVALCVAPAVHRVLAAD